MSSQISLRLNQAKEFIRCQDGGYIAPIPLSEEEINPQLQDDLSFQVVPLESKSHCYKVDFDVLHDSLCSEFSYFEDGRQRTINIGHIQTTINGHIVIVPIHFFAIGAVILHRDERHQLKLWEQPLLRMGIIVERSLIPDQHLVDQFEKDGLEVVSTNATGGDYLELRMRALQKSKDIRLDAETKLITKWRQSREASDHFLVVDGTLMNFRNEDNVERCVGVSKSFGSRYFDSSDHNRILQMDEFERSCTFRFHEEGEDIRLGGRERVSWYLRLRKRNNHDPEFGLVRVEMSQRFIDQAPQYATRLSKSLLSERLPAAYPAPRWDKHLYPIQSCENYLSSVLPASATIIASMKG